MKNITKYAVVLMAFAVCCFATVCANAQQEVRYTDAQSNVEATFDVELLNKTESINIKLLSDSTNSEIFRYGRSIITQMENSDSLLFAYDCIADGVANGESIITVKDDIHGITFEQLQVVTELIASDYPEYFWFNGGCYAAISNDIVTDISPVYTIDEKPVEKAEIQAKKVVFEAKVDEIINEMHQKVNPGSTDYETQYNYALWLHDKVSDVVEYKFGPNNQSAYGALVDGEAVCAGYAESYQYLLNKAGINAWSVRGHSVNPETGIGESHKWNIIWLDGNCVYADITWDDQGEELFHLYFARSIDNFNSDHAPFDGVYASAIPVGNHDKCEHSGYFENILESNVIGADVSGDKIKNLFNKQGDSGIWDAVIYDPTGTSVINWINAQSDLISIVPSDFDGVYCAFSINYLGNDSQGAEIHISAFDVDTSRLYLEPVSDLTEGKFRMVAGMDDMEKDKTLLVAFYDEGGVLLSIDIKKPSSFYEHIHMHIPKGCHNYKVMLVNDNYAPLCKSISLR